MKKILFGVLASASFALIGCGSGDVCALTSKCSADTIDQTQRDACKAATASGAKCAAEYTALVNCSSSNQKCTAANTTDAVATATACATQATAYGTCLTK